MKKSMTMKGEGEVLASQGREDWGTKEEHSQQI